jgi:hypothetical protein
MRNLLVNARDQRFVLLEQLGIERLFASETFAEFTKEDVLMMQAEAEKMALQVLLPAYRAGDREGCVFRDGRVTAPACFREAYAKYAEGGWVGATGTPEAGGQGMPITVYAACAEFFCAANFALFLYPAVTGEAAGLIERFGTPALKDRYLSKMNRGIWSGTMCITEPEAGSDVGAIRTAARRLADGAYGIQGTKRFISGGDHDLTENIIHTVLVRIEGDPAGTEGLSLFVVPKYRLNKDGSPGERNNVYAGNIEHKMGIRGVPTCTMNFGDTGTCVGELLGKEREGMAIMFHMMNVARLGIAVQSLGHASAAYEHALQYAGQRVQGVPVWEVKNREAAPVAIIRHPDIRRTLLWMKARVEGIRAMNYFTAFCMDRATISAEGPEREKWQGMAEILIPLCKAYASDKAFLICSKAIDIYGGYGYCSEYPVEQYLRDCKIASIYEGTNGIQALDLVGRKLGQRKGANVAALFGEFAVVMEKVKQCGSLQGCALPMGQALQALKDLTMHFAELGDSAGFLLPVLNAAPYLEIMGDVAAGCFLMQGAAIAVEKLGAIYADEGAEDSKGRQRALVRENPDVAFYQGKIAAAKFFAVETLSTVKARCDVLKAGERAPLEIADESF